MAEERIPLDVKAHKAEALSSHMQKHLDLRKGPFATPMTPFSSLEGGGESPFARVDSMGTGLDGLSTVSCWQACTVMRDCAVPDFASQGSFETRMDPCQSSLQSLQCFLAANLSMLVLLTPSATCA